VNYRARIRFFLLISGILLVPASGTAAEEPCLPVAESEADFENRFGRHQSAREESQLRRLLEAPAILEAGAARVDGPGEARIEILTDSHVVYPVAFSQFATVFGEVEAQTRYIPHLVESRIICFPSQAVIRQYQRLEIGPKALALGPEYHLDVWRKTDEEDVLAIEWLLAESLDGRLAYNYGSWYVQAVTVDDTPATYIRHYGRNGLTTRVPGVRFLADRGARGEVKTLLAALYEEVTRRY